MNHATLTGTGDSDVAAVGASSATFSITLRANERYRLSTNANLWFVQAAAPTAVKNTAPCAYLAAGAEVLITTTAGLPAKVAVIQDGASTGFASISRASVGR
jgi:hypothetical protein